MVNFVKNFATECMRLMPPIAINAVGGLIYSTRTSLPKQTFMQAWMVWDVAEKAFIALARALTEERETKRILQAAIVTAGGAIGIHVMRKRGLLGDKMMYTLIAWRIVQVLMLCFYKKKQPTSPTEQVEARA